MATKTFEELKQLAIQIRDEKTNKQNTATRIGTQMLEHLNKLEQDYYDKTATDEELKQRDEKLTELSSQVNTNTKLVSYKDYDISGNGDRIYSNGLLKERTVYFILTSINTEAVNIEIYLRDADIDQKKLIITELDKLYQYTLEQEYESIYAYNKNGDGFSLRISIDGMLDDRIKNINSNIDNINSNIDNINVYGDGIIVKKSNQGVSIDNSDWFKKNTTLSFSLITEVSENIQLYLYRNDSTYIRLNDLQYGSDVVYTTSENFKYAFLYSTSEVVCSVKFSIKNKNKHMPSMLTARVFQRGACIGDSYTSGHIQLSDSDINISNPNYSFPFYMGKITGQRWDNYGKSGSTAKMWVLEGARLSEVEDSANKAQVYNIFLCLNDRGNWSGSYDCPLGTADDITTDADSFYAYYYKLIQRVVLVNNQAVIFCNTSWLVANDTDKSYNEAIRTIVNYCHSNGQRVYCCDLASPRYTNYYKNPILESDRIGGHHTAIGYELLAENLLRVMSDIINENISELRDIFRIPFSPPSSVSL